MGLGSPQVICTGAMHWDVVGRATSPLSRGGDVAGYIESRPGGVALNVAVGLARHGGSASLCSVVGADDGGRSLVAHATAIGVDCRHVAKISGASSKAYVAIEDDSGNLVAAVADATLLEDHADTVVRQFQSCLAMATAVFVEANLPETAIERIAAMAEENDIELIANPVSPAKAARLKRLLPRTNRLTIIANKAEAQALTEETFDTATHAAEALRRCGAETALVTDGARFAALATPDGVVSATPPAIPEGHSVSGVGDALLAAYLASPDRASDPLTALDFSLRAAANFMKRST